jgi:hypothetical protein
MAVAVVALTDSFAGDTLAFLLSSAKTTALHTALGLIALGLAVPLNARRFRGTVWSLDKRCTLALLVRDGQRGLQGSSVTD